MKSTNTININLSDTYMVWLQEIKDKLKLNNIKNFTKISNLIYESLKLQCNTFLQQYGYTEYDCNFKRFDIVKDLKSMGLSVQIKSNDVLWEYLSCFTDLTDYTKCFDICLVSEDFNLMKEHIIFIPYKNIIYGVLDTKPNVEQPYIKGIRDALVYLIDSGKELSNENRRFTKH